MTEEPKPASGADADAIEGADAQSSFDVGGERDGDEGRRRRPVADWGGDELFAYVPRRRFNRAGAPPRRPGAVPASARATRRNLDLDGPVARPVPHRGDVELNAAHIRSGYMPSPRVELTVYEPAADDVVVSEMRSVPGARRHRPGLPMSQRLGPRPDRIAAWAFMLGVLLILLAVGTADAAGF